MGASVPLPPNLDLATLRLLLAVARSGSFTAAAERLGVTQSTVSYGVDKLRGAFGDPLFVREAGRQVVTARGAQIAAELAPLLDRLDGLARPARFDPAALDAEVTIACNYYERLLILPAVMRRLRATAPGLLVSVIDSRGRGIDRLLAAEADLLIGPHNGQAGRVHARPLRAEDYVCLMDPDHPAAAGPLSLPGYLALDHVLITYEGRWRSRYLVDLAEAGHDLRPSLSVPSPAGVERLIAGTRLVATLPRRLAEEIGAGLALRDAPLPGWFTIAMVWPERHHREPLHRWLRATIREAMRGA